MNKHAEITNDIKGLIDVTRLGFKKENREFNAIKKEISAHLYLFSLSVSKEDKKKVDAINNKIRSFTLSSYMQRMFEKDRKDPTLTDLLVSLMQIDTKDSRMFNRRKFFKDVSELSAKSRRLAASVYQEYGRAEQPETTQAPPPPKKEVKEEDVMGKVREWQERVKAKEPLREKVRRFQEGAEKWVREKADKPKKSKKEFIRYYTLDRKGNYRFFKIPKDRAGNIISFRKREGWARGWERDLSRLESVWANPATVMRYEVSTREWNE
jgi:hypothetical protein